MNLDAYSDPTRRKYTFVASIISVFAGCAFACWAQCNGKNTVQIGTYWLPNDYKMISALPAVRHVVHSNMRSFKEAVGSNTIMVLPERETVSYYYPQPGTDHALKCTSGYKGISFIGMSLKSFQPLKDGEVRFIAEQNQFVVFVDAVTGLIAAAFFSYVLYKPFLSIKWFIHFCFRRTKPPRTVLQPIE